LLHKFKINGSHSENGDSHTLLGVRSNAIVMGRASGPEDKNSGWNRNCVGGTPHSVAEGMQKYREPNRARLGQAVLKLASASPLLPYG